jgi:hypothetical protein
MRFDFLTCQLFNNFTCFAIFAIRKQYLKMRELPSLLQKRLLLQQLCNHWLLAVFHQRTLVRRTFGSRAAKLHFLVVAVSKLKAHPVYRFDCNSLCRIQISLCAKN